MKSIISTQLYKSLLYTDFNLLYYKLTKKGLEKTKYINFTLSNNLTYLNLFESLKSFKQYTRNLQFIKKKQLHVIKLSFMDPNIYIMSTHLLKKYKFNTSNIIFESYKHIKHNINNKVLYFFCSIGLNNIRSIKTLFKKGISFITRINCKLEQKFFGNYKIFNSILTFKKLFFFFVFLQKVYKF